MFSLALLLLAQCSGTCTCVCTPDAGVIEDAGFPDAGFPDAGFVEPGSVGCSQALPTVSRSQTWMINGVRRSATVAAPVLIAGKRYRVVISHHGCGWQGSSYEGVPPNWSPPEIEAAGMGEAIFIYPDGLFTSTCGGTWPYGWDPARESRDVAFFDVLVAWARATFCVTDIFVAGRSSGGGFVETLACTRSGTVSAFAVISGWTVPVQPCAATPIWMLHSEGDTTVPIAVADSAFAFWSSLNGCSTMVNHGGCQAWECGRNDVEYCRLPGGSHWTPTGYGSAIWAFFMAHSRY